MSDEAIRTLARSVVADTSSTGDARALARAILVGGAQLALPVKTPDQCEPSTVAARTVLNFGLSWSPDADSRRPTTCYVAQGVSAGAVARLYARHQGRAILAATIRCAADQTGRLTVAIDGRDYLVTQR